ncbi:MAG: HupE/UreJ family protein, partial [Bacteroidales bacterium]|nr:HupE/UreJ family protein [Bacteroidales bacterium]
MMFICGAVSADDPGITKVRLIQETDTSYIFELDIARQFLWTIKAPILPDRFRISDPQYEDQSGWITMKAKITTADESLSPKDEILLPWQRNGVDITVQWKDGKIYKGLFNRTLNGIHIPLSELMPVQKTTLEVLQESFEMGVRHLPFMLVHFLLTIVLVWAFPSFKVLRYLFMITLGQMAALILVELGIPGLDLLFSDLILMLIIFLVSYSVIYKIEFRFLKVFLFTAGAIHGASFVHDINVIDLPPLQRIQALFAFNLAMDLGHYLFALVLLLIIPSLQRIFNSIKWFPILTGSISVFLVLLIF